MVISGYLDHQSTQFRLSASELLLFVSVVLVLFFSFSFFKFKQLNGPTNRSTINLTKSYLHSMCMRTMYKCLNACMYVVHRVT